MFGLALELVRCEHGVVELFEEGLVLVVAVAGGEAKGLDAFDEDFGGVGLGLDEVDDFVEVVLEGHGAGVGGLLAAHELGLDVGWGEFDNFDVGRFELIAKGLAPGVDGGLRGAVGGSEGQGDKGQAGGDGHDGSVRLLLELREQRGSEADGAEEIGDDDGLGVGEGFGLVEEVVGTHDAGVVDDDVEGGVAGG